ncbi:SspB-related isopeptide-forming adhesin [Ligilactobacillus salivarius]|uniref:SspB-related isopeptide-forming adhesin n=2 Tax=Ligilactobacillus salivarius TaxID=1624 RepID=UPI002368CAEB|nr:SspB-related isopeptide-forming adhesin [Ligilactobacillus salivarius]
MVSKNNMMLLENKQNRKNMRYGIRKFSSGTASVLLGFTVAGTVMMMANHEEASADTVGTRSNTNSVSSTTQNASVPIQSPKSQDVQNAVNNAVKQGVQVTQNNSQTIVAHNTTEVQQAQQRVSQANQQQADKINSVAQQQKQLNDQYAREKADYDAHQTNTNDATTVNKQNSDKLQAAVQAAKAAGVQVTQNQTQTLTATNSTYNSVKQDVNNKYNQQVSSLKSITDAQKDLNNRYNSAKADAQNLNSDSNSTRNSLDSAIRNAKSTNGVKLIDDGTRNVTVDVNNYNSKKAEIERDNKQQADSINSRVQQYKNEYAKWEKDNQQFLEAAAAKTGWSVKQVLDFLGKNLPNVSYVSAGNGMTFDKGTLQSFSQSELSSILNNHKVDPALKNYIASKAYGNLYKLSQGVTWKYNNAFTDTKSGKSVDLKVTVQGLGLNYSGRYGLPPMMMVGEKYIGSDVAGIGAVKYGLTFLEHGTNTPINITSLIGIGDVDAKQSVAVYNATSALRGSENKDYSGTGYLGSINRNGVDDFSEGKNTHYQSWFLVPNSSTVSYVFSAADPAWGNDAPDGSGFMGFYHQNLGGIPLPIKSTPIIPPTLRYHHTNVAVQKPTPLKANYTEYQISTTPGDKIKNPPDLKHKSVSYTNYNIVYQATSDKNWKEGSQTVNGKMEINEDIAHAKVDMTVPSPSTVNGRLTHVSLTDNYSRFAKFVTVTGANVYENERNATADYAITNANNAVTATRKNPATVNGGTVSLVVDFKVNPDVPSGTKLVNSGSGTINTQTVPTPDAQIVTFTQKPTKHWIEGSQVVDGKTYINDDIVTTKVDMDLPDPKQLAKTLSYVGVTDDYRDFKDKAVLQSYKVLENGTDVTSQYTVINFAGLLQAVRKNAATTPAGKVSLIATFTVNHDVKSGTTFTNRGSGRINNHTVDTNTPQIVTFKQDTSKHWVEGSQVVDDKTYINEDMVHGQVTMTLPNRDSLAKALTDVTLVDNYSDYANKVSYVNAQVFENGTDVTSQYTITNAGNKITATRKNPGATPSGSVRLVANFRLNNNVPSGTKLINRGSGRINNNTVNTNEAKILTYVQSTDKHWVEGSQTVDGKTYIANDVVHGQVSMTLPDPKTLATPLKNVTVVDNYRNFMNKVDYQSAQVLENGKDVTSLYTITNANGHVIATRKDAATAPNGSVTLNVHWRIHKDVKSGTVFVNGGDGRINDETVPTPNRNIVTFKQDGLKDWLNSQNQVVNGKTYIDNDMVHAKLAMNLPDPKALAAPLTKVQLNDDYTNFAKLVDYVSSQVLENGTDVTSQYTITNANGHVIATRKNAATTPGGKVEFKVNFKIHTDVPSNTTLMNSGEVTLNTETIPTPTPDIVTYKPNTDKHWVEGSQVVDGKTYIDNDFVHGQVTMTLPDPTKLAEKLKHVSVTDDYSRFAKMVDYQSAQVLENGKDVTSLYTITNANGKVVATRKDASTTPNGSVTLNVTWRIHTDVKSGTVFVNGGDGRINDETVPTPDRNIVTYKQDGFKDWINSQNQVVNDKTYIDNDVIHAKLVTTLPNPKALATPLTKVQIDDDYTSYAKMVDYVGARVLENGTDVTSQYTITNANGHVTATRKDPSKAPNGNAELRVDFRIHTDVPSGTKLFNSGSVTLNTETIPTPTPSVETYRQDTDKHWVEGSQVVDGKTYIDGDNVSAQVSMTLPEPSKLAEKLKRVVVTDDFSKFADKVDYKSAKVLENGKDVTAQYDIRVANGHVIATRKDASTTPAGKVVLQAFWKVHNDIESNTQLVNSGSGQINDEVVPTPDRTIVTYKQDTEKHWRDDGEQIVDGKIAINDDVVTARVDMTLPKEENLAKPLDKIQLVDDFSKFADKVTLQAVHVYETGKDGVRRDVTDQYDIHVENGRVVATRKDASKVYDHTGVANATMKATLKANKALNVNDLVHTASANVNDSKVSTVTRLAFNRLFAKSFITSNLAVTSDNNIKSQIDMAVPTNVDAKTPMTVTSDYSNFAKYVNVKDATVYENGKNVTADYTIKDDKAGHVTAIKKAGSESDGGKVSLVVDYEVNHGIPNGTILENHGSGTLNGQDVPTNTPSITTYNQDTSKHWVEGDQNVDGKIYVNGSTAHAQVSMTLPDQSKLINKLSNVSIDDDYSKFAKLVDYKSAKVLENGKDVTSEYTIKNANGHVTAVRKDASKTPAGNVQLLVDFEIHKDVKSGTELVNGGSGTLNKNTVPTNTPSIWTYTPDGEKHWVLDNNVTDNKIYFSGDKAVAQVSVDLPDTSKLATPLSKLVLVDNYSDFADKVKLDSAKVLENGKDVTSEYDLTNKDGKVVATRKDAAKTPSGKAVLVTTFTINNGIENATALHNKGSVTVDSITDEVPDTPIVVFTPKAHKDVELGGDVKGDTENSVDGSLILNGSVVTYPITTSDLPAERAEDVTKRVVKDTLDKNAEFVGFKAWVESDKGELEDVTSHYKLDKNGQDLTFTEDSYLLGLYNKDKSKQTHTPIIDLVVKVKGDAQKINNKATVLTNDNVTETNKVTVETPSKPTPTKVDNNEKGVNIDGKNVLPGSVNNYELTMDLAKFKGIKVTDQDLAKGFYFVDDYPEEALDVDPQTFTYKTVDGKTVKGLSAKVYQSLSEVPENVDTALKANGITPSGAFVLISADDPAQFFKDYVETGTNIIVNAPMKVKEGFAGKYQNKAWQLTFGQGEATDIVSNNVPKIDPKKDIVISADNRTSLNNHTIELGQNFDYLLKGGILDKDQGHDIYEYKWVDDYDENHDQYNGQFIAPLTVDVTLKDGTVLKAGTDISNHVSQNIDTKTGSVEFSVDKDFLDKVDFDKSGFAADILMSVKRIKAGEVDNTYTNIINGQKFSSNTVHSTTPEPKVPETPATPKTPEPKVPETPATPQPVKMVTSTPAPKAPESPALPQMGDESDSKATAVGLALLGIGLVGMAAMPLDRKRYGLERSSKEK